MDTNQQTTQGDTTQQTTTTPTGETSEQQYQRLYGQPAIDPATLTALQQEVVQLREALVEQASQQRTTPQVTPTTTPTAWVDKIREGDFAGAQKLIEEGVRAGMASDLESVRQRAYQDALNATTANWEMEKYRQQVLGSNPDLASFERYIQPLVAEKVEHARAAGKIKTTADFLREYRSALDAEVSDIRKLGLQFRAAGKDEALTRSREVLASTTLSPQQLQLQQGQEQQTQVPTMDKLNQDYFSRRAQEELKRRGLAR
jgi:hypothetical protein